MYWEKLQSHKERRLKKQNLAEKKPKGQKKEQAIPPMKMPMDKMPKGKKTC